MLVLKRKDGQWIEVVHSKSGDLIRIRTQKIRAEAGRPAQVDLVFDDDARNFAIDRPERHHPDRSATVAPFFDTKACPIES